MTNVEKTVSINKEEAVEAIWIHSVCLETYLEGLVDSVSNKENRLVQVQGLR